MTIVEDTSNFNTILVSYTQNRVFKHNNENVTAKVDYQRKLNGQMDFCVSVFPNMKSSEKKKQKKNNSSEVFSFRVGFCFLRTIWKGSKNYFGYITKVAKCYW